MTPLLNRVKESKVKEKSLSRVRLFATPWTVAHQAPPSMGFSRQEYWSGLPFPFPGNLPNPGIEPGSPSLEADTLTSEHQGSPIKYSSPLEFTYVSESESVLNIILLHLLLIYKLVSSLIYVGFVFLKTMRK